MVTLIDNASVAKSVVQLAEFEVLGLANACVYCNLSKTNTKFGAHMEKDVYAKRAAFVDAIDLIELSCAALLYGDLHFLVEVGGSYLKEQYPPYIGEGKLVAGIADIVAPHRPLIEVTGECVMIGRYGVSTWGHWFGELLPKILIVERRFPGRFAYVLPDYAIDGSRPNSIWSSIQQSLAACGIGHSRICAVAPNNNYRFTKLFVVSSLWSDHVMHPAAARLIREHLSHIPPASVGKLAIKRHPMFGRQIENGEEVYALLEGEGYRVMEVGLEPFDRQIALFKGAKRIFSVLGSDLTNVVASPQGVEVLSAAPDDFGDRFFYALILERGGRLSDLRGPSSLSGGNAYKGAFRVDPAELAAASASFQARA